MNVEQWPIKQIKPYWRNPRNNEKGIEAVAQSIKNYGFNSPIILDAEGIIIAGHTRYKAAKVLGMDEVPVVVLDIAPAKAREYRIADNKTSELSSWDMDLLYQEIREFIEPDKMQVFFGTQDLSNVLNNSVGINNDAPTQAAIDVKSAALNTKYKDGGEKRAPEFLEMICPHCSESFSVDKAYVMELLGV